MNPRPRFRTHHKRTARLIREIEAQAHVSRRNDAPIMINAVLQMNRDRAFRYLISALFDSIGRLRSPNWSYAWQMLALGYLEDPRALDYLIPVLERGNGKLDEIVETVGRIGVATDRLLVAFDRDRNFFYANSFHDLLNLRVSWALAFIISKTDHPALKRQAALQLLAMYPDWYYDTIAYQLPWFMSDMRDYIAVLLDDPDRQVRINAACFLGYCADPRGADSLLDALKTSDDTDSPVELHRIAEALVTIGDRRIVPLYVDRLGQPDPRSNLAESLYVVLRHWGTTLTDDERQRLASAVPGILSRLSASDFDTASPYLIEGLRKIGSAEANRQVDDWFDQQLASGFARFREHGVAGTTNKFLKKLYSLSVKTIVIARDQAAGDAIRLPNAALSRDALSVLQAQYRALSARNEIHPDLDTLIVQIGWLGDPHALPFLYQEFDRLITGRTYQWNEPHSALAGEIIYAIANIGARESVPFLLDQLRSPNPFKRHDVMAPIRDFIKSTPDKRLFDVVLEKAKTFGLFNYNEIIHSIGATGSADAISPLIRLLPPLTALDDTTGEVITTLAKIAHANRQDTAVVATVLAALSPLLRDKTIITLSWLYHPVVTMRLDQHTALALQRLDLPEARTLIGQWRKFNPEKRYNLG